MKQAFILLAPLALAACVTTPAAEPSSGEPDLVYARLGQTVTIGGPRVTPLAVLEDSRCPQGVQCVWAGQVRITARISTGGASSLRELTSGKPIQVADGTLTLADVQPPKRKDATNKPGDYRFGFRFDGGL